MSGRRWIVILLATFSISFTGCHVDGGAAKMWNPFARADRQDGIDEEQLPKFARRGKDDDDESKKVDSPIAESRVEALLAEGQRGLQENRIPEARRAYNEVLQFLPDDPTAHHGLAMAADLTENWAEAEDHYRQALRAKPRDANLLCDIGYSYLLQHRYSEAASYLSQAIQINPNHENAHANLALLDVRQGNREAARERLTQRYHDPAKVTQILASLESTPALKTAAAGLTTSTTSEIPKNVSFEEIREIANRERIAAEQRRVAISVPADQNSTIHSVSATNLQNAPTNPSPGSYLSNTGTQTPTPAQFGSQQPLTTQMNPSAVTPQYAANPGQFNFNESQQAPVPGIQIQPRTYPPANLGGLVAVRPSGSFQPPTQGVSFGQPMGFSQPAANMTGQQNSTPAHQYPNTGQNYSNVQLDGLNIGPGSLFPIGQGYTEQNYSNQGYSNPQYPGNTPQGTQYGMPNGSGSTTAPRLGNQPQPVNPLSSYENQLRQLDNQYNNTLQQMDPNSNAAIPRARY